MRVFLFLSAATALLALALWAQSLNERRAREDLARAFDDHLLAHEASSQAYDAHLHAHGDLSVILGAVMDDIVK